MLATLWHLHAHQQRACFAVRLCSWCGKLTAAALRLRESTALVSLTGLQQFCSPAVAASGGQGQERQSVLLQVAQWQGKVGAAGVQPGCRTPG